jgi:phosphofructokinase-like protein
MRLGILTGGGDCPGLNAVIRAAALRLQRSYEGHLIGFLDGWRGLIDNQTLALDLNSIRGILPRGGTILGTSRVDPIREAGLERLRAAFALHELTALLVCGGDGTLNAALTLSDAGLPIIGIPKTIDNDVPGTDYSFGFDTALTTVVRAVDALHTTAEAHDRVIVLETMGRSVGWLAVCAGIAGGADVTVVPERPMSVHDVCECVRHRKARGRDFSIVVVAEGASFAPDPDGHRLEIEHRQDRFGRPIYGGVGEALAREIERRLAVETRTVTLGYVQRGGTPTAFDRLLGSRMGVFAVDLAAAGRIGTMVALHGRAVEAVELSVVRSGPRAVDDDLLQAAQVFFG